MKEYDVGPRSLLSKMTLKFFRIFDSQKTKKENARMKRTEITYQVTTDDKIKIINIKNVADQKEIAQEFGKEIARIYFSAFPHYDYGYFNGPFSSFPEPKKSIRICAIRIYGRTETYYIRKGTVCNKDYFESAIKVMKQAGNRLQRIKKGVEELPEPKTIRI